MTTPNDAGRTWEYTTTNDNKTYTLNNGGWTYYSFVRPVVYRDTTLWSGPTYLKDRKKYIVQDCEYTLDPVNGLVVFNQTQGDVYIYVTLDNAYLRNTNEQNQLCLDCHVTTTHKGNDCTVCHGLHNTNNLYNVREKVNGREVVFTSNTSLTGTKGICAVCHSATVYHNATALIPKPHYNNQDCANCHPHRKGFPTFTTVLSDFIRQIFALVGLDYAYAAPAPLDNYSMGGSFAPVLTLDATVETMQTQPPQTITTDVIYYYHNDHLGTPLYLSDESGNVVWQREQMPFGETSYERGNVTENLRFPGQYWDEEKNSSYNMFRDSYVPALGKYGQPDPIGQEGGINPYSYSYSNPENEFDSLGLDPKAFPILRCHVNTHNDPMDNAIGGLAIATPLLVTVAGPSAVGLLDNLNIKILSSPMAIPAANLLHDTRCESPNKWPAPGRGGFIINGIEYTEHALQRMAPKGLIMKGNYSYSRGIPPSVVENAIAHGVKYPGNEPGTLVNSFENVKVITNTEGTRVITAY
jgi:RHS repeat-associated protein